MKNIVIIALAAMFAMPSFGEKVLSQEEYKKLSKAERKAYSDRRRYEHHGGDLVRPGSVKGCVKVIDCRADSDDSAIADSVAYLKKETRFEIVVSKGKFEFPLTKVDGVSLFVIDDAKYPTLLFAPENMWAVLNVSPLREGAGSNPAFLKARTMKEMSRAFAGLCGAMSSNFPSSLTGGVFKPEQLDKFADQKLSIDVVGRMAPYLEQVGVTPAVYTTYRRACIEGWAPAPTNDVQKAIVAAVANEKAETLKGPSQPRKIVFDAKKGE